MFLMLRKKIVILCCILNIKIKRSGQVTVPRFDYQVKADHQIMCLLNTDPKMPMMNKIKIDILEFSFNIIKTAYLLAFCSDFLGEDFSYLISFEEQWCS